MSEQDLLADLAKRGLRAWQATFVASFVNADPSATQQQVWAGKTFLARSAFQLLAAPVGTGKMFAAVATVRELVARGSRRILILAPTNLCEVWWTRIGEAQSEVPVSTVTRRTYREMVAAVPVEQSPWSTSGVFVMSQDLAKQADIAASLSAVTWDLVTIDEAHRFAAPQRSALLDLLESRSAIRRLLLLTATPLPALEHWLHPSPAQPAPVWAPPVVTSWYGVLRNWDGSVVKHARFDWKTVRYTRGPDEVRFISRLRDVTAALVASGGDPLLPQLLNHRAASSTFAADLSLQHLRHALLSRVPNVGTPIDADSDADAAGSEDLEIEWKANASPVPDTPSALKAVEQCLEALESVNTDEKLNALKALVLSIAAVSNGQPLRICIVSRYADTVTYLNSALEDADTTVFMLSGRDSFSERTATVERFRRVGGLLVGTDGGISEGIELGDITHVLHYDVPLSAEALEQRCDRVDCYGRTGPLTMYIFLDDSGAIPSEVEANDRLQALGDRLQALALTNFDFDSAISEGGAEEALRSYFPSS